jgi:cell volume regulation protein A
MFPVDGLVLLAALLALSAIALSKVSARIGVPALVLFVGLGMLAGSEGPGGIEFDNYQLAHGIGTVALVFILFDGGLRTSLQSLRLALWPSLTLATAGVVLTAAVSGLAATWVLDVPLLEGLLLGSIVGSTDAAAVFALLRSKGMHLYRRVGATLEVESGANDPMAVFLTVVLTEVVVGAREIDSGLAGFLALQAGAGAAVGVAVGFGAAALVNRVRLSSAGLYPVLSGTLALLAYGLAAALGGSGFLAVYLAGIIFGNRRVVFQRGTFLFHDGLAWLSQIAMFVVLGLLSYPNRLLEAAGPGLLLAAILIVVARPLAVTACLLPFRYSGREVLFISWVGLRGAVPIVLAIYPVLRGVPGSEILFDVVFFAVFVSVLVQGWSLPTVARWLRLQTKAPRESPVTLELFSLHNLPSDVVQYDVAEGSAAAGRLVRELDLPPDAVLAMIVRGEQVIPPRGSTRIEEGDHVSVVVPIGSRAAVDRAFAKPPGVGRMHESGMHESEQAPGPER